MFIKTKIFNIFFLILSLSVGVKKVYATTYFSDNFDNQNLSNWVFTDVNAGQESWKIIDGKLVGEVSHDKSSYLVAKSFFDLTDYSIQVDVSNEGGVDQEIIFRVSEDMRKYYMLNLRFNDMYWPQDGGEIVLWKYTTPYFGIYQRLSSFNDLSKINLSQNQTHKIKIEVNLSNIKIYFDSVLIIEFDDNDAPVLGGSFGFYNWGGNYYERPTKNLFDNLVVGDFNYENNFIEKQKIIIIPGFGASWNSEAIVYNRNVDNNQWVMTPFVRNYDGLIKAMEDNSLEINKDFYVWNYDWRKPLVEIVDNLNIFINQKISSNEKVVLVGHSLGGLVSRIWAENNKDDSRLEKVITLGSPHLGSVDAYEAWNGGQISDLSDFSSIALKVLLKLQGLTTRTDMEAVRTYTPSVKDLLPTFSFLKKDGLFLSNDQLETKNDYLINQNNLNLGDQLNLELFVGKGYETTDSIKLKKNTIFDRILGLWPDGKIDKFLYTNNGDGTVLVKSANYDKNNFIEVDSKHGEIVGKTINQVMLGIGLSEVNITSDFDDYKDSLVVFVGSPVNYSVKCDDEPQVLENNGFVIIKNNNYNFCTINLVGNNDGLIHLVVGNTNDNNWFYWEKNITNGEINNIKINPKNGQVIEDNDNISFLRSIIRDDINSLLILNKNNKDLKLALKFLEKNQPKILIKNIFDFRQRNNEKNISQKIIDNTTLWLSIIENCSKNKAISGFKKIDNYQNLINKLVSLKYRNIFKISENSAISYKEMERLLEFNKKKINDNDYFGVCANNFTAMNYGSETLKISHKNDYKKWLLEDSNL